MSNSLLTKIDAPAMLTTAVAFFVCVHAMDVISTAMVMAYVPGSIEANPFLRDPITLKFMLLPALQVKALSALLFYIPISVALYIASRSWGLASLPFWLAIPGILQVAFKNFVILMLWGVA